MTPSTLVAVITSAVTLVATGSAAAQSPALPTDDGIRDILIQRVDVEREGRREFHANGHAG